MEKVKRKGLVVSLSGETACVCIKSNDACSEDCEGCSFKKGLLDADKKELFITAFNGINAKKGQFVEISILDRTLSAYAFMLFIFPLIIIFSGALVGYYISTFFTTYNVLFSILGGITGFLCGLFIIRMVDKKSKNSYTITKIIS